MFVSCSQFQQPGRTSFELVRASFYDKKKPVWPNPSKFQQPGGNSLSKSELLSTTRNNQFELVTASINHLHLLCTTTSNKQFELVTASMNHLPWSCTTTSKNQF